MARKLIWLSDSPALATGFGRVTRQVLPLLVERLACDVVCLGFGHPGTDDVLDQLGYQLLPQGAFGSPQDNLARVVAGREATVVTLGDAWDHGEVARAKVRHRFRWVAYVPVDSGPLPRKAVEALLVADAVLTPSHYGRSVLREALPELPVSVAYHGVDCGAFTRLADREALREANGLHGRFVVGLVGRNQPRKQIPVLVRGFAKFAEDCPEAFLYLHTDESPSGWDVPALLVRHGLEDRSRVTANFSLDRGLSDADLTRVYNLFDVLVLPSSGEGFGMPLLEAMAAGVPVVTTDASSNRELVEGRGLLIAVRAWLTATGLNLELALPDEDDLAAKLGQLWRGPDLRASLAAAGLEFARQCPWERCADALAAAIREVESAEPKVTAVRAGADDAPVAARGG